MHPIQFSCNYYSTRRIIKQRYKYQWARKRDELILNGIHLIQFWALDMLSRLLPRITPVLTSRILAATRPTSRHVLSTMASNLPPTNVILCTVPSRDVGKTIAHTLVEEHLVACVNIVPGIESVYYWEGKVNSDNEELLIMKTAEENVPMLTQRIKKLHPYDECEVIALPIVGGSDSYLKWVVDSSKPST
jgi:periplasmic divalent cation tolerance protein